MKVIVTSMPKAGTKTLATALRILGYNVYDYEEQFWYLGDVLLKAMKEGCSTEVIREIFKDVDAVTDCPACTFWEDILKAFPDAKVIHTKRENEDIWLKSLNKQLEEMGASLFVQIVMTLTPTGRKFRNYLNSQGRVQFSMTDKTLWKNRIYNPMLYKLRYREHNARVLEALPKDKLLQLDFKDGWKPLCKFLDVEIPDSPFPHQNKRGEMVEKFVTEGLIFGQIRKEFSGVLGIIVVMFAAVVFYFFM